jgi:hypothetical protein
MEITDGVGSSSRLRDGVAATNDILVPDRCIGSRPVIGTDVGEGGNTRKNHESRRFWMQQVVGPVASRSTATGFENDRGAAGTAALQVQVPPPPIFTRPEQLPLPADAGA